MKCMYTAATGMDAQTMRINNIANNLANANTTGFKQSQVDFADLMYMALRQPGRGTTEETQMPTGLEIGSGVYPVSNLRIFTQGALAPTNGNLDLAISGAGFFQVQTPDGEVMYTRDGTFRVGADGNIVNSLGYELYPSISIPSDAISDTLSVGEDGSVAVQTPGSDEATVQGTIQLATFPNPAGLRAEGNNLLSATTASGSVSTGDPGADGLGRISQGYLEKSNVDVVTELVDMIIAQRTYELNSKVVKAGDRVLAAANTVGG